MVRVAVAGPLGVSQGTWKFNCPGEAKKTGAFAPPIEIDAPASAEGNGKAVAISVASAIAVPNAAAMLPGATTPKVAELTIPFAAKAGG